MAEDIPKPPTKPPTKSTSCGSSLAEATLDVLDVLSSVSLDPATPSAYQSSPTFDPKPWEFLDIDLSRQSTELEANPAMAVTSTPVFLRPKHLHNRLALPTPGAGQAHRGSEGSADSLGVGSCVSLMGHDDVGRRDGLQAPIIGYEVMEQRAKFTVFKIHVRKSEHESWVIFRRYTDFARVNNKLRVIFPMFRLALPPKRWFGGNFDPNFLEDRQIGLQAFINNIIGHKDIVLSGPAREFLCLDEPPGPYDNLEESRALCESLDETVYSLRLEISERDKTISRLNAELQAAQERLQQLPGNSTDKTENTHNSTPVSGENSTIEGDLHSQAEADQLLSFTQAEVHSSSVEPSTPDELAPPDRTGSQSAAESGAKQGLTEDVNAVFQDTQPSIIAVT